MTMFRGALPGSERPNREASPELRGPPLSWCVPEAASAKSRISYAAVWLCLAQTHPGSSDWVLRELLTGWGGGQWLHIHSWVSWRAVLG